MSNTLDLTPFEDVNVLTSVLELKSAIEKVMPSFTYEGNREEFEYRKNTKFENVINRLDICHIDFPNIVIGSIGYELYDKKYFIANENIKDGRNVYRYRGQVKASIHLKNIVRVAKKTLAPYSFKQVADKASHNFRSAINNIRSTQKNDMLVRANLDFEVLVKEVMHMKESGYTPLHMRFKEVYDYVMENKDNIAKYYNYDPEHYFVWITAKGVQFKRNIDTEPTIVKSVDYLPENIRGKMFVLDISDARTFVEDVGLKENDSTYWVMP
jgi:hypothetical protein